MTTWNDRLNQAMKDKGVNAARLAREMGISAPGMKKWVDGVTLQPKYEDVMSACRVLDISPEWLMNGVDAPSPIPKPDDDCVVIEQIDIKGSCGFGCANWEDVPRIKEMQVTRAWFEAHFPNIKYENVKVITACGDSMVPIVNDNDAVFINISDKMIREGVYALMMDGELYIKRLQRLPAHGLRLKSENPAYDPIDISEDSTIEVNILGRVIKAMKVFTF